VFTRGGGGTEGTSLWERAVSSPYRRSRSLGKVTFHLNPEEKVLAGVKRPRRVCEKVLWKRNSFLKKGSADGGAGSNKFKFGDRRGNSRTRQWKKLEKPLKPKKAGKGSPFPVEGFRHVGSLRGGVRILAFKGKRICRETPEGPCRRSHQGARVPILVKKAGRAWRGRREEFCSMAD